MKKNNGQVSHGRYLMDYAVAATEQMELIVRLTRGVHRLSADPDYLFAASFGSRCLDQAWKKESLELGQLCYSSLARFRRAILGRIATAAWREQRPSSDAKRIRCAGHVITSKIELHRRAYSSPMRKGNFDLVERWKQFVTTVVQSSREPVKRKRPNETENRLCERDDGGTCA
jgi:hypothetical protein